MLLKEKSQDSACEPEKEKQESLCAPREGENFICPVQNCSPSSPFLEHLYLAQWRTGTEVFVWRWVCSKDLTSSFFFLWKTLRAGRSLSLHLSFSLGIPTTRRDVDLKENHAQLGEAEGDLGSNETWKYSCGVQKDWTANQEITVWLWECS